MRMRYMAGWAIGELWNLFWDTNVTGTNLLSGALHHYSWLPSRHDHKRAPQLPEDEKKGQNCYTAPPLE